MRYNANIVDIIWLIDIVARNHVIINNRLTQNTNLNALVRT